MRALGFFGLLILTGCASTQRGADPASHSRSELESTGVRTDFVSLRELAADLKMRYREDRRGFLELSSPPHSLMFTPGTSVAHVNGKELDLGSPLARRGQDYSLRGVDAQLVRAAYLGSRTKAEPFVVPAVAKRQPSTALPAAWEPARCARPWSRIVVHHTATKRDCCAHIDKAHRGRGWDHGCGYHFVIGNGTMSGNGETEVGNRWLHQIHGAHTRVTGDRTNFWNENGIGVVVVGNFEQQRVSDEQLGALVELVRKLQARFEISSGHVVRHGEVDATMCPGAHFPWTEFKRRLR
ncbi:MAG: peptidoglycan recognition family protein [Planctomycetota bacterium]